MNDAVTIDTSTWTRHQKLAAVLPSGRPVFESTPWNAGHGLVLTLEAYLQGYRDAPA
jgi:hypothetical protein